MKAYLMYRDRDFDLRAAGPPHEAALAQDLELNTLLDAMAAGDPFLRDAARKAVLTSLDEPAAILYRQRILADCLERSAIVREMYALSVEAFQREPGVWGILRPSSPDGVLYFSVETLQRFMELLKRLRRIADAHDAQFQSEGFKRLFAMLAKELDDEYLAIVEDHLRRLTFRGGVLMSAGLDKGNKGKIGFVFQQFHLLQRTTVLKNVMLPLIYADQYPNDAKDLAAEALSTVGLADRLDYSPGQLSGGQQQRVAIARALITDPSIILADEPTGNLDSKSGAEVLAIFQRLHSQSRTIVMVTHDREVAEHTDRIIVMEDGRIAEEVAVAAPLDAEEELTSLANGEDAR